MALLRRRINNAEEIAKYRLKSALNIIALEPRLMYDAAAVDAALTATSDNHDTTDTSDSSDSSTDHVTPTATSDADSLKSAFVSQTAIRFEENDGQYAENVKYAARGQGYTLFITDDGAYLTLQASGSDDVTAIHMSCVNGNENAIVNGVSELITKSNYLIGDSSEWITNVSNFEKVSFSDVYDGIDMILYGSDEGKLEYDFVVDAGVDYHQIELSFDGSESLSIDSDGNLVIGTVDGNLVQDSPVAYQIINGETVYVDATFHMNENGTVSFDIGDYDTTHELYIDPVLHYSTYLGTSGDETWSGGDVATDNNGNTYVTGSVSGSGFPASTGVQSEDWIGGIDSFVTKYDENGVILYSTYIGGTGDDIAGGIAISDSGDVYISGTTFSTDFPTTDGSSALGGTSYAYIVSLDNYGVIDFGTNIGGTLGNTTANDIAVDASENVYITGATDASDFYTTPNAAYNTIKGGQDAYVLSLDTLTDTITYSSLIGGNGDDIGYGVDIDAAGNMYIAGQTGSTNYITSALRQVDQGGEDLFLTKFNVDGTLGYSTYLGGNLDEFGHSSMLAVSDDGTAYVVGTSESIDYVRQNAQQNALNGDSDGVLTVVDTNGNTIMSTYVGGSGNDGLTSVALDAVGNIYASGYTDSTDFNLVNPIQSTLGGGIDGVLIKFNTLGQMLFSTYMGGAGDDIIHAVAVDSNNDIYIAGSTTSDDLTTTAASGSPEQENLEGASDFFVARIRGNASPTINDDATFDLDNILEDATNVNGISIYELMSGNVTDVDSSVIGIAIIGLTESANGVWQYSTDSGVTWQSISSVSETNALLLSGYVTSRIRFIPNADWSGSATFTFRAWDQTGGTAGTYTNVSINGGGTPYSSNTGVAYQTVEPVPELPTVSNAVTDEGTLSTSGLVITPSVLDNGTVTHYKITNISNGILYLSDGTTVVNEGDFITVAQGAAGLKWMPTNKAATGTFGITAATAADDDHLGDGQVTAVVTVNPVAETPTVPDVTTDEDTLSSPIIIVKNVNDGSEVTHFKITDITGGRLFKADGVTEVYSGDFITSLEATAGLRFLPDANSTTTGTFGVQASMAGNDSGLGGDIVTANVHVNPIADPPTVTTVTTNEDTMSGYIIISRDPNDGDEVTHYLITNIQNGTLYLADGVTQINNGDYITVAQGITGLRFMPTANSFVDGTFDVQSSLSASASGVSADVVHATVTVNAVADQANVSTAQTLEEMLTNDAYFIRVNSVDGDEVTHFMINNITYGTLYLDDGVTQINNGDFITVAQGLAGLKFVSDGSGNDSSFYVYASLSASAAGVGSTPPAIVSVSAVAEAPNVTTGDASSTVETKSGGLIITRSVLNGPEVKYFQITGITNGTLYLADGTEVHNGDFISVIDGIQGLTYKPTVRSDNYFLVKASTTNDATGLSTDSTKAVIIAPVLPSPSEIKQKSYSERHSPSQAQTIGNNLDRIAKQDIDSSVSFNDESYSLANEEAYNSELSYTINNIRYAAMQIDLPVTHSDQQLMLDETIYKARMAGMIGVLDSPITKILGAVPFTNEELSEIVDAGDNYQEFDANGNLIEDVEAAINDMIKHEQTEFDEGVEGIIRAINRKSA